MNIIETLSDFYDLVMAGNTGQLTSLYSGEPLIDTPLDGRINSHDAFIRFVQKRGPWLREHKATTETLDITEDSKRICVEIILYFEHDKDMIDIPVAIVADLENDKVSDIRIYHSTWPLTGTHRIRSPILKPSSNLEEPQFIKKYMKSLKEGDADKIVKLFDKQGYVREPSGSDYMHAGEKGIREFYDSILHNGGISLRHCTSTFNGKQIVIEYIAESWGRSDLIPQAGVAVYEISDNGKIVAARIYDDVNPPEEL